MANTYDKASLVLIPSGTKEGVVFSQKPTNGDGDFTFSRSTAATRVNADGLIEKETQNLLLQSNSFDTTWTINGTGTLTSGQTGYDGTNDAWLLTKSAAATYLSQNTTLSALNTFSVYAKAGTNTYLALYIRNANQGKFFNLANGTIQSDYVGTPIDAKIEDVGNGWYRCSVTTDDASNNCRIYPTDDDGNVSGTSGNIYIQDAQLEEGLVARDYIETTTAAVEGGITDNVPRLDYTDSSCPALKLEPQRTNAVLYSEYIAGYSSENTTITQNYGISPEGVQNSARVQFSVSGYIAFGVTTYTNEVTSMYVKGTAGEKIRFGKGANVAQGALYTLTGDWQRIVYDVGSPSNTFIISNFNGGTANDFEVYGLQHEEGSYATSYIPTYGASVTFAKDVASKTGVSDLIGQTEGTLFAEVDVREFEGGVKTPLQVLQDADNRFGLAIFKNAGLLRLQGYCRLGGIFTVVINYDAPLVGGVYKMALGYAANDWVLYVNGIQRGTNTTSSVPTTSICDVGNESGTYILNDRLAQTLLFKTRLTNAELATLTTL